MTIGELKKKLEMYKDDTEIFIGHYDDCHGITYYSDPLISQTTVDATISKKNGEIYYSRHGYADKSKHHTILTIE